MSRSPVAREPVQVAFLVALVAFPLLPGTGDYLGMAGQAAVFTVVAASLVLLTGWVGQISLGHAALVGIGAYGTGWAAGSLGLGFPLSLPVAGAVAGGVAALLGVVALRVRGLYLAVATLIFSWAASEFLFRQPWLLELGAIPAQTVGNPGTLFHVDLNSRRAFYYVAWAVAVAVLYALTNLRDSKTGRAFFAIRGSEMAAASLGMDVLRYKALAFALSGALAGVAGNLVMTHSRVVSPDAFDFNASLFYLAIAVVGGLGSLAGGVGAAWLFAGMNELFFRKEFLNAYLQLSSTALLAIVFRLYPGGLAALGLAALDRGARAAEVAQGAPARLRAWLRDTAEPPQPADGEPAGAADGGVPLPAVAREGRLRRALRAASPAGALRSAAAAGTRLVRRTAAKPAPADQPVFLSLDVTPEPGLQTTNGHGANGHQPPAVTGAGGQPEAPSLGALLRERVVPPDTSPRTGRPALVSAEGITVRFGGLTAVDDASMTVREGEICGLIGPNGAGKTTLFNSIAGFNSPTEGTVRLYGIDVTSMPVHRRAQLGVARTFQIIQLFGQLTVFDNLLAATHLQNPTGFVQHLAVTPSALVAEAAARTRVRTVIELLDLEEFADRPVAGLPFGILRMVEVARALVSGARLIMLDEPASGLDENETDRLTEVLRLVRGLGATLLLIEHDVRMVTSVTDYIYVLDRGRLISEGVPEQIQSDPAVISAYLGEPTVPAAVS